MQQADGQGFNTLRQQLFDYGADLLGLGTLQHDTVTADALGDFSAQVAGDNWFWKPGVQVVHVVESVRDPFPGYRGTLVW